MSRWLVLLAIVPLNAATPVHAQMKGSAAGQVARVAASRIIDLRLSVQPVFERPSPLVRELLVNQRVAGNAAIGVGMASFYSRRKGGSEWRVGDGMAPRARKPAVTFLLKF